MSKALRSSAFVAQRIASDHANWIVCVGRGKAVVSDKIKGFIANPLSLGFVLLPVCFVSAYFAHPDTRSEFFRCKVVSRLYLKDAVTLLDDFAGSAIKLHGNIPGSNDPLRREQFGLQFDFRWTQAPNIRADAILLDMPSGRDAVAPKFKTNAQRFPELLFVLWKHKVKS